MKRIFSAVCVVVCLMLFNVQSFGQATIRTAAVDTFVNVGTTAATLSSSIGSFSIDLVKFQNLGADTLFVGSNSNVGSGTSKHGDAVPPGSEWFDGVHFFYNTESIWLVSASGTLNVRIKIKARPF